MHCVVGFTQQLSIANLKLVDFESCVRASWLDGKQVTRWARTGTV